ncbi:hypothetical protein POVCU2_0055680 [Plasmodium ovale curtisi]|uniref:PIR Superfamily Protein n=1 Tax=Plasmodium ovale curtisi TaxID=864141 RepID=A0A1A8W9P6_PLAOA|nr:hypothetical protein POVCU2_0055680 [Plasmodium ovale curtisi]
MNINSKKFKKFPKKRRKTITKPLDDKSNILYIIDKGTCTNITKKVNKCSNNGIQYYVSSNLFELSFNSCYNNAMSNFVLLIGLYQVLILRFTVVAEQHSIPESMSNNFTEVKTKIQKIGGSVAVYAGITGEIIMKKLRGFVYCAFLDNENSDCVDLKFKIGISIIFFVLFMGTLISFLLVCIPTKNISYYNKRQMEHIEYYKKLEIKERQQMYQEQIQEGQMILGHMDEEETEVEEQ